MANLNDARRIAAEHRAKDPGTTKVFAFRHATEIRLVEVTESVADTGEIVTFCMSENVFVILLHPQEWIRVKNGELLLPDGWSTDDCFEVCG